MNSTDPNLPLWLAFLSISEQATHDWLTGLHNRRYFEETLADHMATASRYNRELSLVLFDLDQFKQINDTLGHAAGDATLRHFAECIKTTARQADIVCRYGGDEFAVILPETSLSNAWKFVARVFQTLEQSTERMYSATAGIAALPCEDLLASADADLLARKKESRQSPNQ